MHVRCVLKFFSDKWWSKACVRSTWSGDQAISHLVSSTQDLLLALLTSISKYPKPMFFLSAKGQGHSAVRGSVARTTDGFIQYWPTKLSTRDTWNVIQPTHDPNFTSTQKQHQQKETWIREYCSKLVTTVMRLLSLWVSICTGFCLNDLVVHTRVYSTMNDSLNERCSETPCSYLWNVPCF